MEIPLLGQGNNDKPEVQAREVEFALLLTRDSDGTVTLSTDISTPVITERTPIPGEVMDALHSALENIKAQQIAAIVLNGMVNMSQMAMQAQQNQQIIQQMGNGGRVR